MSDLPEYVPSKDELKTELPLAFACARLGIALSSVGKALCPFHDDHDPSFDIYLNDRGEWRYHCAPCGLDGDVFDLIQRYYGCTFKDALGYAASFLEDMPEDYRAEFTTVKRERTYTHEDMRLAVEDARLRAARPEFAGSIATSVRYTDVHHPELAARWDEFLRGTCGWGITETGDVVMPHWDLDLNLVGYKLRKRNGDRLSYGDYDGQLYGAWLGTHSSRALITEGETDFAYARWIALQEEVDIDVFSLPGGAGKPVKDDWLKFLGRYRELFLVFDPDGPGVQETWRWIAGLKALGKSNFRICSLPLGRDLRDAKPSLEALLTNAREPLEQPLAISNGPKGYERETKDGATYRITDWTLEPKARLVGGEEPGYDVTIHYMGLKRESVIRLADLVNAREVKKWCTRHSLAFTARDDDLQRIVEYLMWRGSVVPEIYQSDQVGIHPAPVEYKFAGTTVLYPEGYVGRMPWRYVPSARASDVTRKVLLPTAPGPFRWSWFEDFLNLSTPDVTHPLLAWLIASTRRPEAAQFPLLFIGGSSGVGKSTLARVALRLMGSSISIDLGNVTPFILVRTLAASSSIPVFIDEWTRMSRKDTREAFQGNIPILYDGGNAERGQADLSAAVYRLTAPVMVAGEDAFNLDREIERMVTINPTRAKQNPDALARIISQPLERFGRELHTWLTESPELRPLSDIQAPDRVAFNRAILHEGWATLRQFLYYASRFEDVPEISDVPDLSALDLAFENKEENVYDQALLYGPETRDRAGHQVVWRDPDGRGTWARFQTLVGLLQTNNVDIQLPGGSRSMKAYFEEKYGALELGDAVTPPGAMTALRAWLIPGHELPISEGSYDAGCMPS